MYAFSPSQDPEPSSPQSTQGYLYTVDLTGNPMTNGWGGAAWGFPTSGQTCGTGGAVNSANFASVAAPTVDPADNMLAVGAGCDLYWWVPGPSQTLADMAPANPVNGVQQVSASQQATSGWAFVQVDGFLHPPSGYQHIDSSPLVTPSMSVTYPGNPENATVTTPFACVGSWDGGLACGAMAAPPAGTGRPNPVEWVIPTSCETTDNGAPLSWNGTCENLDPNGITIITSSPSWDPEASVDGSDGAAVFGLNGESNGPGAVVFLDPLTGASRITVLPGAQGISSSVAVYTQDGDGTAGRVYAPTNDGDVWLLRADGTVVTHVGSTYPQAIEQSCGDSDADISNIAVGAYSVYAVEDCLGVLYEFDAGTLAFRDD